MPTLFAAVATAVGSAVASPIIGYFRSERNRARRVLVRARQRAAAQVETSERALERRRRALQRAIQKRRPQYLRQLIETSEPEVLKPFGADRVRWDLLREAGVLTLRDLKRKPQAELEKIPGIGEKSAERLVEALAQFERDSLERPLPAPEPELTTKQDRRVAKEVLRLVETQALLAPVIDAAREVEDRAAREGRPLEKRLGFWGWLFRREQRELDSLTQASRELATELNASAAEVSGELVTQLDRAEVAARNDWKVDDLRQAYAKDLPQAGALVGDVQRPRPRFRRSASPVVAPLRRSTMSITLRRYQEFGTRFLLERERTILGDEMGLGKTIQSLAAMAQIAAEREGGWFVVVAPASLLLNWMRETEDKSFLNAHLAWGPERDVNLQAWFEGGGVLVVSYATLRTLKVDDLTLAEHLSVSARSLDFLVVDEAHFVKNPEALRTEAVAGLVKLSQRVVLLSGTPMENHPREFVALAELLELKNSNTFARVDLDNPHSSRARHAFREAVAPFYLRRNQEDVLIELPPRIEKEDWVALDRETRERYAEQVARRNFMGMRQVVTIDPDDPAAPSAKLDRLEEIVTLSLEAGEKVLVFSYFLKVLDRVADRIPLVGTISGSVSVDERQTLLDRFTESKEPTVLAGQITAAGQGLNIQAASVVILVEPQLTPGVEAQAIARAHRMGQTRPVRVHRLLGVDSVDTRIHELLDEKSALFADYARVSRAKENNPEAIETSMIEFILDLERERVAEAGSPQ